MLIVEDEFLIAFDVANQFEAAGAGVLGPFADVSTTLQAIEYGDVPDAAVLGVNLGGESSLRIAQRLAPHRIPFVFATGYDSSTLCYECAMAPVLQKPFVFAATVGASFPD